MNKNQEEDWKDGDYTVPVTVPGHEPEEDWGPAPPITNYRSMPEFQELAAKYGWDWVEKRIRASNAGWYFVHGKEPPPTE